MNHKREKKRKKNAEYYLFPTGELTTRLSFVLTLKMMVGSTILWPNTLELLCFVEKAKDVIG